MTLYAVKHEENWEPWYIEPPSPKHNYAWTKHDLPDDLVLRFQKATTEMEAVWRELADLMREKD